MCDYGLSAAIIAAVGAVAGGVTTYVAQENQAEAEKKAAEGAAASDYQRATVNQEQINASAAQDMQTRLTQSLKERAAIRVSAGEAGLSTGREEVAAWQSASKDVAILEANRSSATEQVQAEKAAIAANAQSRLNAAQSRVPSSFMSGLQIVTGATSAGLSGYAAGKSIK